MIIIKLLVWIKKKYIIITTFRIKNNNLIWIYNYILKNKKNDARKWKNTRTYKKP